MIFQNNKYTRFYFSIINAAKSRTLAPDVYIEKHHIVPKSLNGSNTADNLVALTAREHFVCHRLLVKMTVGQSRTKMAHAAWRMVCKPNNYQIRHIPNSRTYQIIRAEYIKEITNKPRSLETKLKLRNANLGKTHSDSSRQKMSKSAKSRPPVSNDTRAKKSASMTGKNVGKKSRLGKLHSNETKLQMSLKAQNRKKTPCPYCGKEVDSANLSRHHGVRCKSYSSSSLI